MILRAIGIALILLLLTASNLRGSHTALEAQVSSVFGVQRAISPLLHDIAQQRAIEISANFSHDLQRIGTAEVLAWNSGALDPLGHAVNQWLTSPSHSAILFDVNLTQIGCADHEVNGIYFAACVLAFGSEAPPVDGGGTDSTGAGGTSDNTDTGAPASTGSSGTQEPVTVLPDASTLAGNSNQRVERSTGWPYTR